MSKKKSNNSKNKETKKMDSFFYWDGDVLVLNIFGTPGAKLNKIGKVKGNQLKVSVTEDPKRGRATDHMVRFLAKVFDVSVSSIEVVYGEMNINKQLRIKSPKKLPAIFTQNELS